eukprot:5431-Heterococcus_DN1.PRE.2
MLLPVSSTMQTIPSVEVVSSGVRCSTYRCNSNWQSLSCGGRIWSSVTQHTCLVADVVRARAVHTPCLSVRKGISISYLARAGSASYLDSRLVKPPHFETVKSM